MADLPGSDWLRANWNEEALPNNSWVAVTENGVVAENESLEPVIAVVRDHYDWNEVSFAYITFDLWQ